MQRAARRQLTGSVTCHSHHHQHHLHQQIFNTNFTFLHPIKAPADDHHHYLHRTLQKLFRVSHLSVSRSCLRLSFLIRCFSSGFPLPSLIIQDADVCPSTNSSSRDKNTIGVTEDENSQTSGMKASEPLFDTTVASEGMTLDKEEGFDASSPCIAKQAHRLCIDVHCVQSIQAIEGSKLMPLSSEVASQPLTNEGTHLRDWAVAGSTEDAARCDYNSPFDTMSKVTKHESFKDVSTTDLYLPTGSSGKSSPSDAFTRLNIEEEFGTSTEVSIVLLLEKHGWGQYTEDVLHNFIKDLTPETVLKIVDELRDAKVAFPFLQWAARQKNFKHKEEIFTKVVGRLGKDKEFEMAWTVLEYMKKQGLKVDYAFGIFMHRLKSADMADSVAKAMDNMFCLNVMPTVPLYTLALQAVLKANNVEIAQKLYNQMRQAGLQPDAKLFGTLITGFGKAGMSRHALFFFKEMQRDGIAPDSFTYTRLIRAFAAAGKYVEGQIFFTEMVQNNCFPAALSRDDLECALFGVSSMEQIKQFLENLQNRGHVISAHTYSNMFQYLLDKKILPEATEFFRSIIGDKKTADMLQRSKSGSKLGSNGWGPGQEAGQPKRESRYGHSKGPAVGCGGGNGGG